MTNLNVDTKRWDARFSLMPWWKTDRVAAAKVMVVGAGALGNEVLKNLTLLGIGNIVIADFDTVEYSNLSRSILFREEDSGRNLPKVQAAATRIKEINPNVNLLPLQKDITIDIGLGVFRRMDVIVGCLDNRLARMYINRHAFWMGKTWIDGAIDGLAGQLNVYTPGVACYESGLTSNDIAIIRQRQSCPDKARRNLAAGHIPTTPISASIIGAMQAQEALKIVNGQAEKVLMGHTFFIEGMNNDIMVYENTPPDPEVMSSNVFDPIIEAPELKSKSSIKETLDWLRQHFQDPDVEIELRHRLVQTVVDTDREEEFSIIIPYPHLSDDLLLEKGFLSPEKALIKSWTSTISSAFPQQEISLEAIGIPALDVITVFANGYYQYVELTGDEDFLTFN